MTVAEPAIIELVKPDPNAKITITVYENKIKFFTEYFLEKQLLAAKGQAMDRNRLRYYAQSLSLPVKQMNKAPLQQAIEADAREYNFRL